MRNYGGDNDRPEEIITCSDGGYAIVGTAGEDLYPDGGDILLVRIDNEGNQLWNYTYPLPGRQYGKSVVECPNGGFLVCAGLHITGINFDVWLIKIDADGHYLWDSLFGGSTYERGRKIIRCTSGGYAVAGTSENSSILLMRFDENLNLLWRRDFGSIEDEFFRDFVECADGGFAIVSKFSTLEYNESSIWVSGTEDVLVIRTDADGNQQWNKTYGGTDSEDAHTIIQCADGGGYAIAGRTSPTPVHPLLYYYHYENWILRLNPSGDVLWQKKDSSGEPLVSFTSMVLCSDEGFAIAGFAFNPPTDIILQRTDLDGNQKWNQIYCVGVYGSVRDLVADDENLVVTGYNKTTGSIAESQMFVLWFPDDAPTNGASIIPLRMEFYVIVATGLGISVIVVIIFHKKRSTNQ